MGRKAGITKDEYLALIKLNRKDFDYREWVALAYAREWTFEKGGNVSGEIAEEFRRHYTPEEQALILKLMRTMLFANYCGNWFYKRPWRTAGAVKSCDINFVLNDNKYKE